MAPDHGRRWYRHGCADVPRSRRPARVNNAATGLWATAAAPRPGVPPKGEGTRFAEVHPARNRIASRADRRAPILPWNEGALMIPSTRRPRIRRSTILIVVAVAALAFPLGVLANHQFTDVPTGASYHDEVEELVDAGITAGCGGTNYCPTSAVTRGSMAQFLVRGLGSVAQSGAELVGSIVDTDEIADVASVTLDVPGVSGTQYVQVQGSVVVYGASASCPCNFGMAVAATAASFGPNRSSSRSRSPAMRSGRSPHRGCSPRRPARIRTSSTSRRTPRAPSTWAS